MQAKANLHRNNGALGFSGNCGDPYGFRWNIIVK